MLYAVISTHIEHILAKEYWQHTGNGISSRLAEFSLASLLLGNNDDMVSFTTSEELGIMAKDQIRKRLASLYGAVNPSDFWIYPTGMSAIYAAMKLSLKVRLREKDQNLTKPIQFGFPYVDTLKVMEKFTPAGCLFVCNEFSTSSVTANATDTLADLETRICEHMSQNGTIFALFCEIPSNPLLQCPDDMVKLRQLADKYNFPIVVDDTLANFINVDLMPYCDILCTSLTKIFSGASNVMAGSLFLNPESRFYGKINQIIGDEYEDIFWKEDAIVLERNSRDCLDRIHQTNRSCERLADSLSCHAKVEQVYYPKYVNGFNNLKRPNSEAGYGNLISLLLKDKKHTPVFFDSLQIYKGPSLGTNFTLACPYTQLAHFHEFDWAEQYGVSRWIVRIAVGLEPEEDILRTVIEALENST